MKIAFIAWTALEPVDRGYRVRSRAILRHLPDCELLLVAPPPKVDVARHEVVPLPMQTRLPLPLNGEVLTYAGLSKARTKAISALEHFKPQLVWCEGLWSFPPAERYRRRSAVPVLLGVQNIESEAARRRGRETLRSRVLASIERKRYAASDLLVTCSETDREELCEDFGIDSRKILVLPNGIERFVPPQGEPPPPVKNSRCERVVLFVGKLDYGPNRQAVEWMLGELVPALHAIPHRICLVIVGGPRPERDPLLSHGNVRVLFTGRVAQVAPYIAESDVCIAPVFSGSGTRIKILEYLAAAKPVVANSKAVEGLELQPGEHFESAEQAVDFASAISRLLDQPEHAREVAGCGKHFVEQRYLWEKLVRDFYDNLQETLATRSV